MPSPNTEQPAGVTAAAPVPSDAARARVLLIVLCIGWGVTWPMMSIALREIPPFSMRVAGLILGAFALGYSIARMICEHFREPDAQLGFLWNMLTMGTLLSLPLMLAGLALIAAALRRQPLRRV